MARHKFDPHSRCLRCGLTREETIDQDRPRCGAGGPASAPEAQKAPEAPRYFDKHGTEIFKGDQYIDDEGQTWGFNHVNTPPWHAKFTTVLSRADGTPVYRYKGGEDVRMGDTFWFADDETGHVNQIVCDRGDTHAYWATCTLIRRADESEKIGKPNSCACCHKHASVGECGLCLICWKPGNTKNMNSVTYTGIDWCTEVNAMEALVRFLDWCNQPTLAQRFEAFRLHLANAVASLPGDLRRRISTLTDLVEGEGGSYGTKRYDHCVLTSMRIDDGPWHELGAFPLGAKNSHLFATIDATINFEARLRLCRETRGPANPVKP